MSKQIAYRFPSADSAPWYVAQVKGDGGVDWGYTTDISKAIAINTWVWRQFAKDMREVGSAAFCHPVAEVA